MSSAPVQCLVLWNQRKKVMQLSGKNQKADLISALLSSDFRDAADCERIEVYNSRFDTFVDIEDDHTFCDGDRIQLVAPQHTNKEVEYQDHGTNENEGDVLTNNDESDVMSAASTSGPAIFPRHTHRGYKLPAMPFDIKVDIANLKQGELSSSTKSRIVSWITTHLRTISLYPGELYDCAAKELVQEYPILRDFIGTGYDSWKVAFQYRMGNVRKLMGNVPVVQEARKKFGHKRSVQDTSRSLKQCRMLHQEFQAVTGVNLEKEFLNFINVHGDRCLYLTKTLRSAKEPLSKIETEMATLEGDAKKHRFAVGVVEILAFLVKEKPHFLGRLDVYPALITKDTEDGTILFAAFEGLELEALDLIGGFVLLMELYWVFNVKYSHKNKNVFALVEHFCGLPSSRPATLGTLQAISAIKKLQTLPEKE
ncbi:hypothetical protein HPB49_019569 [Dermacentor silvarum]|uniref:Uncharacterized protein n=1 Tax=Dermacentor silvarum TaxID=543639 RepID=A0ACB8CZG0_DERSI|nr:hypothetical protein HPB49_019569 [Dermacentor silvarum]